MVGASVGFPLIISYHVGDRTDPRIVSHSIVMVLDFAEVARDYYLRKGRGTKLLTNDLDGDPSIRRRRITAPRQ